MQGVRRNSDRREDVGTVAVHAGWMGSVLYGVLQEGRGAISIRPGEQRWPVKTSPIYAFCAACGARLSLAGLDPVTPITPPERGYVVCPNGHTTTLQFQCATAITWSFMRHPGTSSE